MRGFDGEIILPCSQGDDQRFGIGACLVIGDQAAHASDFLSGQIAANSGSGFHRSRTDIEGISTYPHINPCLCSGAAHRQCVRSTAQLDIQIFDHAIETIDRDA